MDIKKAFKSRLLFMVTAILLVFAANSAFAAKTPNISSQELVGKWVGTLTVVGDTRDVELNLIIKKVSVTDSGIIKKGSFYYVYEKKKSVLFITDSTRSYFDKYEDGMFVNIYGKADETSAPAMQGRYKNKMMSVTFYFVQVPGNDPIIARGVLNKK